MKKIIVIIMLFMLLAVLPGCRNEFLSEGYKYKDSAVYMTGDTSFSEQITTITIDWLVGDIMIYPSNTGEISIKEEVDRNIDDSLKMHYYLQNGVLDIRFCDQVDNINHRFRNKKLYVYLPTDQSDTQISIKNRSADITVKNIQEGSLFITNESGDLTIRKVVLSILNIKNNDGDMTVANVSINNVEIRNIEGDLTFSYNKTPEQVRINADTGDITIYVIPTDKVGFQIETLRLKVKTNLDFAQYLNKLILNGGPVIFYINTEYSKIKLLKK